MNAPHELPLCDIVMEGGITSGIIYPRAVVKLQKFRIKSIGGTSAGAIAAAATAAAELGRARDPKANPGFVRLANLPTELAGPSALNPGSTRLLDLFQPSPRTQPLFTLLISTLNATGPLDRVGQLLLGAMHAFCERFYIAAAVPLIFTFAFSRHDVYAWIVSALLGVVLGGAALLYSFWRVLSGAVVDQGYGICRGFGPEAHNLKPGDKAEPLTLWLARLLNECAGKQPDDAPLTFGELWEGAGPNNAPPQWLQDAGVREWRYIELQMMTTSVSHGRPYRFPFADDDQHLFFDATQLREWFPDNVVNHMVANARDYAKERHVGEPEVLPTNLLMLPSAANLPVVFATRLSLSFPLLLCAVPLWAPDFENRNRAGREFKRCWFSDGGISSNFPIHFFDAPLPMWPTFGLKLESELACYLQIKKLCDVEPGEADKYAWDPDSHSIEETNRFFLPGRNSAGRGESWCRFDDATDNTAKLIGFALGLFDAARNWRDRMLTRAPGVRDRVIRLYLKQGEGGLNLNMQPELVTRLAGLGEQAAERLIARFAPPATTPMGMDNHRWVRLRNLAAVLERDLSGLHRVIHAQPPDLRSWSALIADRSGAPPDRELYGIDGLQPKKLEELLQQLAALSYALAEPPTVSDGPKRPAVVRIVPNV